MGRLDEKEFSHCFRVRALTAEDKERVYALCLTNPDYYEACGRKPDCLSIERDMTLLPSGKTADSKYFVGFFSGKRLIAVLDLIDGYPDASVAYIGLFMTDGGLRRRSVGSEIIRGLCSYLKSEGICALRLACLKKNVAGSAFWAKNGFGALYETEHDFGLAYVLEKDLKIETDGFLQ